MKAKLMKKWGIRTNFQFWIIMIVFSLAGSSTVKIRKPVFEWLNINDSTPFLLTFLAWLVVFFPAYQLLLMFWGTLLGQFQFVWWFEKKMLRRMRLMSGPDEPPPGAKPETVETDNDDS